MHDAGANPTTASYNASVVKNINATSSTAGLLSKNDFYPT
jgi:hypothetical protein